MTVSPAPTTGTSAFGLLRRHWLPLGLAALTAVFIAQNRDTASIDVLTLSVRAPLWFVLAVVFCLGTACGWLLRRRRSGAAARSR